MRLLWAGTAALLLAAASVAASPEGDVHARRSQKALIENALEVAIEEGERALLIGVSDERPVRNVLVSAYSGKGEYDEAIENLERLIEIDPFAAPALRRTLEQVKQAQRGAEKEEEIE